MGGGKGGDFRVGQHKLGATAEGARRCQFSASDLKAALQALPSRHDGYPLLADPTPQQEATQTRCCMKLLVIGKDGRQMHATALVDTGKQLQR